MTTDVDWHELIDRSFEDGPGHRPVEQRLVAGRRALRRRRVVVGAAAVALIVAAGGAAWAAQPTELRSEAPVVEEPQHGEQEFDAASDVKWKDSDWWIAPGWTVDRRIENPMGYEPPKQSVALELVNPPYRRLVLAVYDGDGGTMVSSVPGAAGSLESWLDGAVASQRGLDGEPQPKPVRLGQGETLVPAEGVTIVDQVPHPSLPANFAPEGARTAAAQINDHGREKFVLVREIDGHEQVIPFTMHFDSLDEFLRYAVQQYDSGEGLL